MRLWSAGLSAKKKTGLKIFGLQALFVFLWSSGYPAAKYAVGHLGPLTLLFFRYVLLSLILITFVACTSKVRIGDWTTVRQIVVVGLLAHALYLSSITVAFTLGATAGIAALIGGLQPISTGLIASHTVGERIYGHQWLGLFIGFFAVLMITLNKLTLGSNVAAYVLLFVSVGCITGATIYQRWIYIGPDAQAMPLSTNLMIQYIASASALLLPAIVFEGLVVEVTDQARDRQCS